MNNEFFCREFRQDDKEDVKKLVESIFSVFLEGKFWNWKYGENPYFDSRLVAVAEVNGEIVGCNHWLLRELKYSDSVVDKAVLAADVAVRPDYRGRGIGSQLLQFLRLSYIVKRREAALIYMFADPELAKKFHTPTAGYILARDGTAQYTKVLNWRKVKRNVEQLNEEIRSGKFGKNLPKSDLKVLFKISAAPPLCIYIKKDGLVVDDSRDLSDDADIMVSGDFSVFNRIKMSKRRKWSFLKALLTGKLKIKVKLTKLFSFFDTLWILEKVFSEKMT
ncbi:GNAT family N-acetyltransferase [Candidatus Bathyarchaeota archaeon]|nr:GNAT family N-acetyltransferase [Candidatus Bathyarchaeota archaeon]